ncbi:hypothetical protein [Actinomadura gamaensis]|uniref:HK97 gp10 family phage protein n=1 Tax=Actinomadura gamaensis TaxID=1763541 RepID=A0ABV9U9L1_9ACTN
MSKRYRLSWDGPKVVSLMGSGLEAGLQDAADYLLQEANQRVPVETTRLRESGEVSVEAERRRAAVSYDTPYAVIQHEKGYYKHAPGRGRKYLEIPYLTKRPEMRQRMAAAIRRRFGL